MFSNLHFSKDISPKKSNILSSSSSTSWSKSPVTGSLNLSIGHPYVSHKQDQNKRANNPDDNLGQSNKSNLKNIPPPPGIAPVKKRPNSPFYYSSSWKTSSNNTPSNSNPQKYINIDTSSAATL